MSHLGIKFPLPKPAFPVQTRELSVIVNSAPARVFTLPGSALTSDEFIFSSDDSYSVTLVDIDSHGNRSLPTKPLSGSIADDLRPATPDALPELVPANKRWLTPAEAETAKKQAEVKAAADKKAAEAKAITDAKAEADRLAAIAKIDADAAKAKAALVPTPVAPAPPK